MLPEHSKGPPLVTFIIVVLALVFMGGIAFAFQGSIHF